MDSNAAYGYRLRDNTGMCLRLYIIHVSGPGLHCTVVHGMFGPSSPATHHGKGGRESEQADPMTWQRYPGNSVTVDNAAYGYRLRDNTGMCHPPNALVAPC